MSIGLSPPQRRTVPQVSAVVELLKPITWFPPMWAFACGVVSSGVSISGHWQQALLGVLLVGPLVCAASQAANDWYDRHVDAINEPDRPIPSGRIPGNWGLRIALLWSALSLAIATLLGPWVVAATVLGLLLAWGYSAPPFRFKNNGWVGNAACAFSYEGLAWFTGAAALAGGLPPPLVIAVAALYSLGAHGIMVLNDFKAMEGDRRTGVRSLPVQLGATTAAGVACLTMALPQIAVYAILVVNGALWHALGVATVIFLQILMMPRLLSDPVRHAVWYSGFGVTLYVSGMMIAAFALRGLGG
ncbi:MAG: chlorophyll synthase ChlG [Beijerinckiaceae bacterium]